MKKAIYIFLFFMLFSGCKSKPSGTAQTDLKNNSDETALDISDCNESHTGRYMKRRHMNVRLQ